jgi:acetoacetate decarboxylase
MRKQDVLKLPSMPAAGPSYPAGLYRFINREFLVITYETDPDLIRAGLPEPLQPIDQPIDQPIVHYEWIKINVKGSWIGPGRLHLVPHVNAPVADFPVSRIVGAHHFLADLTLPYGRVVFDYNKDAEGLAQAAE